MSPCPTVSSPRSASKPSRPATASVWTFLKLARSTKREQLERILVDIKALLARTEKVKQDAVVANVVAIGEWSVDVEVVAWFETTDWDEFHKLRGPTLMGLLGVVDAAGASLAVPMQALTLPSGTGIALSSPHHG